MKPNEPSLAAAASIPPAMGEAKQLFADRCRAGVTSWIDPMQLCETHLDCLGPAILFIMLRGVEPTHQHAVLLGSLWTFSVCAAHAGYVSALPYSCLSGA